MASFRGVSEGNVTRFALAKREPLRVQHENFRDAVMAAAERRHHHARGDGDRARRRGLPESARESTTIDVSEKITS